MQAMEEATTFQRFGQTHQMRINSANDLHQVLQLEDVHWVAISAPVDAFHGDRVLFEYLDIDNDGRIRAFEVRHAVQWTLKTLQNHQAIVNGDSKLLLSNINRQTSAGNKVLLTCDKILQQLNCDEKKLTLGQIRQVKKNIQSTNASPAGVLLSKSADENEIQQFIDDVVKTLGGAAHATGDMGITSELLQQFTSEAQACIDWQKQGELPADQQTTEIMALGQQTPQAYDAFKIIAPKIDQYFTLCKAVELDPNCVDSLQRVDEQLAATDIADLSALETVIASAPIAQPAAGRTLNLESAINPGYVQQVKVFREMVLDSLDKSAHRSLGESQWHAIKAAFKPYQKWLESRPASDVGLLGADKLQNYLQPNYEQAVKQLIEQTRSNAIDLRNIELVEKLLLFQIHLFTFVNNFVSFPHLYTPGQAAMFDMGTLIMDSRRFNLAVKVQDRKEHIRLAKTSDIFTMYLQVDAPKDEPDYEIAVAVTWGGQGNLCVGKRGIFHDATGRELDAKVVHIIENPISLQEAALSPFKRLGKLITGKIESITTAAEKKLDSTTTTAMTQVQQAPSAPSPTPVAQSNTSMAGPLLAGGGIAIAAIGSSLAFITSTISKLEYSTIIIALLAAIAAVVGPMLAIAYMKLRCRDLSAILEGSGWAINSRMRLTKGLERYFTQRPIHAAVVKSRVWIIAAILAAVLIIILLSSIIAGGETETSTENTNTDSTPAIMEQAPTPQQQDNTSPAPPTSPGQ